MLRDFGSVARQEVDGEFVAMCRNPSPMHSMAWRLRGRTGEVFPNSGQEVDGQSGR